MDDKRLPMWLDCDPGHDDMMAMLLAYRSPAVKLLGITTVGGNGTIENTTRNALAIAEYFGLQGVPIGRGLGRALVRGRFSPGRHVHGETGLDGFTFPEPTGKVHSERGVQMLVQAVLAASEPVVLVPTGPLTNVAAALTVEPRMREKIRRIVLMGGAIGLGNRTPAAEANVWHDPEAVAVVLDSGVDVHFVPLEATHMALFTRAEVAELLEAGGRCVAAARLMEFCIGRYEELYGIAGYPLHDPCAVALAVRPELATWEHVNVAVETGSALTQGRTVFDMKRVTGQAPNCHVATGLDGRSIIRLVTDAVRSYA